MFFLRPLSSKVTVQRDSPLESKHKFGFFFSHCYFCRPVGWQCLMSLCGAACLSAAYSFSITPIPSNRWTSFLSLCSMIHIVFFLPPLVPFLCLSHPLHKTTPQCLQPVGLCNLSFHWLASCPELNFSTCSGALHPSVCEYVNTQNQINTEKDSVTVGIVLQTQCY